jgi:predicted amidohydrolase YtcJ
MTAASRRTLLMNGYVHTPADPGATAVLIEDNSIAWIGHEGAAMARRDGLDQVVDLQGALVAPAFVDSHVHVTATGIGLLGLDLTTVANAQDVLARVGAYARELAAGSIVLGHGWDETTWSDRTLPTRADLDQVAPGVAVHLIRIDLHSAIVSTSLLESVPDVSTLAGYSTTGLLRSGAHHALRASLFDRLPSDQRSDFFSAALETWAANGVAAVTEMAGPDISSQADLSALNSYGQQNLGPQIFSYWGELGGIETAKRLGAVGAGGDLFADGSLGSRTARLSFRYSDADTLGVAHVTAAQVRDHVLECVAAQIQAGFHTIGDAAIGEVLTGFEAAAEVVGQDRIRLGRHRLEHLEMPTDHQLADMASLGITASVQPMFEELWGDANGMYEQRLGAERTGKMNPWGRLARAGISMAFGSDSPVTAINPWASVRAAMQHRTAGSAISARAAFAAHTRGGWRALGIDNAGVLQPGSAATLAVWECTDLAVQEPDDRVSRWSTDPRSGTPQLPVLTADVDLPSCLLTLRDGQVLYNGMGL